MISGRNKIFYLHIPKAGGNSFIKHLEDWFFPEKILKVPINEDFLEMHHEIPHAKILYGHQHFPFIDIFDIKPSIITFLRHPVWRTISAYEYIKRKKTHILHKRFKNKIKGIKDFLCDEEFLFHSNNMQTRMLGIKFPMKEIYSNFLANKITIEEAKTFIKDQLARKCENEMFDSAIYRLQQIEFFGITEKFEESVDRFRLKFGIRLKNNIYFENAAPQKDKNKRIEKYTSKEIRLILDRNQYDIELYKYAFKFFDLNKNSYLK